MIITLTVNPAIDKTVIVKNFKQGSVNRIIRSRIDAGGKGINVAKNLKIFNNDVVALGFISKNGKFIEEYLAKKGIKFDFVHIKNEIRTNIKIFDIARNETTDLNEFGPVIKQSEINLLVDKVLNYAKNSQIIVLSGSLPKGMKGTFYKDIIKALRKYNLKTVLDSDGVPLLEAITEKPYLIKPNLNELEVIANKKLESQKEIIQEGKKLIDMGIEIVAITLGARGSIVLTRSEAFKVMPLNVEVKGTVGAGDAYVSGLVHGIYHNLPIEESIKIAAALSTAVVMEEGTQPGSLDKVLTIKDKIEIEKIKGW